MIAKHEWRKKEKNLYLPKNKPEIIDVPAFNFITIRGQGNPNSEMFSEHISALYAIAYTIKMSLKKMQTKPTDYIDFTVYPLEGIWDITEKAKETFTGTINKDDLVYQLMIRQPDFVSESLFKEMLEAAKKKKANPLLDNVTFEAIAEGRCIQMLHLGCYENESISFDAMESFAHGQGLIRDSKVHREIYLSDARKVAPEKLKTVLRFKTK